MTTNPFTFPFSPSVTITVSNGTVHVAPFESYPPHPELPQTTRLPLFASTDNGNTLPINASPPSFHPTLHIPTLPAGCAPGRLILRLLPALFVDPYQVARVQADPLENHLRHTLWTLLGGPIELEQPIGGPRVHPTLVLIDWDHQRPLVELTLPLHMRVHPPTVRGEAHIGVPEVLLQCPAATYLAPPVLWTLPTGYLHHQTWVPLATHAVVWTGCLLLLYALLSLYKRALLETAPTKKMSREPLKAD